MKKILFLIHDIGHGGAERVLVNLVNNMDRTQFDITVMVLFGGGVNEKYLKPDVRYISCFKNSFPGNSRIMLLFKPSTLHKLLIKDHYDIEVSYLEGPSTRIISGCNDCDTKLVAWVHSDFSEELNDPYSSFRSKKEAISSYDKFDRVIGVSQKIVEDFRKYYSQIESVEVLYNTNETDEILNKAVEPVMDVHFSSDEFNIITAGKLTAVKGYDRLIRAIARIINSDNNFPIHLYFLGVGELYDRLQNLSAELGISDRVSFLGYKDNPYKYMKYADLYVCSSLREGFSTAITEALIVGTPVVSTDCSGARELLGYNNEYGIVTENSEDGIFDGIKLMLDGENLSKYRLKAEQRGKMFSKKKAVKAVEEMLLSL